MSYFGAKGKMSPSNRLQRTASLRGCSLVAKTP